MLRKSLMVFTVGALLCGGCAHKAARFMGVDRADVERSTGLSAGGGGGRMTMMAMAPPEVSAASRYVAVRHKLEVVAPSSGLAKSLEAVIVFCGTIQCEVLSSNISNDVGDAFPAGSVSVRVAPGDLNKLLEITGKQGKVAQHMTQTEDKTSAVIDVEAKIKNQTEFRDSLRRMLAKPGVSVADLLQIQEKMAEAQAELDSEATQRKVLANETEKIAVEIDFRVERTATNRSAFAPIADALKESGSVLAESLAALITAMAALIPWLIVIVPGGWWIVRTWRRFRKNRREAKAAGTPAS